MWPDRLITYCTNYDDATGLALLDHPNLTMARKWGDGEEIEVRRPAGVAIRYFVLYAVLLAAAVGAAIAFAPGDDDGAVALNQTT